MFQFFNDLKVGWKLAFVRVVAVGGLLGTSIPGYVGLKQAQEDIGTMYESSVQGIDCAGTSLAGMWRRKRRRTSKMRKDGLKRRGWNRDFSFLKLRFPSGGKASVTHG